VDDFWTFLEAGVSITIANGQVNAPIFASLLGFSADLFMNDSLEILDGRHRVILCTYILGTYSMDEHRIGGKPHRDCCARSISLPFVSPHSFACTAVQFNLWDNLVCVFSPKPMLGTVRRVLHAGRRSLELVSPVNAGRTQDKSVFYIFSPVSRFG
jgi:hypothetical protein